MLTALICYGRSATSAPPAVRVAANDTRAADGAMRLRRHLRGAAHDKPAHAAATAASDDLQLAIAMT